MRPVPRTIFGETPSQKKVVSAQTRTLIGLKPGIKTIAAVHIQCLLRVKSVGSTRPTSSRHVRCASDSSRIGALQRFDEECHKPTNAVQQAVILINTSSARASSVGGTSRRPHGSPLLATIAQSRRPSLNSDFRPQGRNTALLLLRVPGRI